MSGGKVWGAYLPEKRPIRIRLRILWLSYRYSILVWLLKKAGVKMDGTRIYSFPKKLMEDALSSGIRVRRDAKINDQFGVFLKKIYEQDRVAGDTIDDVADVMEWLRSQKHYAEADRLRTIMGRLARARSRNYLEMEARATREIARGWK